MADDEAGREGEEEGVGHEGLVAGAVVGVEAGDRDCPGGFGGGVGAQDGGGQGDGLGDPVCVLGDEEGLVGGGGGLDLGDGGCVGCHEGGAVFLGEGGEGDRAGLHQLALARHHNGEEETVARVSEGLGFEVEDLEEEVGGGTWVGEEPAAFGAFHVA